MRLYKLTPRVCLLLSPLMARFRLLFINGRYCVYSNSNFGVSVWIRLQVVDYSGLFDTTPTWSNRVPVRHMFVVAATDSPLSH
jgi:hypothetical protein